MCLLLVACDDPGEGPRFEAGRKEAEPVVAAIHAYQVEHGRYPAKLDDLVPKYFTKRFLDEHVPGRPISFFYQTNSDGSFLFEFVYSIPGRNRCGYILNTDPIKWECWGHY
jgi:hypothetical protein